MKHTFIYTTTIALLAFFAGGNFIVWLIMIPFWQSLSGTALMQWFHNYGPKVGATMLTMQMLPFIFSIWSYNAARKINSTYKRIWIWVNIFNAVILIMFLAYYLPTNLQFVNQTMNPSDVPAELIRWEIIHIARTLLAISATVLAIIAYCKYVNNSYHHTSSYKV